MIELDTYRQLLGKIRESIVEVGGALNIETMKEQLMELNETMNMVIEFLNMFPLMPERWWRSDMFLAV